MDTTPLRVVQSNALARLARRLRQSHDQRVIRGRARGANGENDQSRMTKKKRKPNEKMQAWIDARKRHRLSHAHVQMARELSMNPKKLGKIDNHDQEPWKLLPRFIEKIYFQRFAKDRPDLVLSIKERIRVTEKKKAEKREAKLLRRAAEATDGGPARD